MATPPLSKAVMQETVDLVAKHGGVISHAARSVKISRETLTSRYTRAIDAGIKPSKGVDNPHDIDHVKQRLKRAEAELNKAREVTFDERIIRETIIKLSERINTSEPPDWICDERSASHKSPGIPTLFASDWHFGEVVDPSQIGGVNKYNMTIAKQRAKRLIETALDLLNSHMVNPVYPGIVFALGGDLVAGDIHEELTATNEMEIMPVVVELFGVLAWCIETLADHFKRVFVPCVSGNHARTTHKIRSKGRNFTSFDWLVYTFLAKRFENDKRVSFLIPNGPDALYKIYGHRYLLTHGDQFRGGDGLIGCLGPIIRGDHKKRSRNAQIDQEYTTMLLGHFHQLMQLERVIVNGSLVGYSEYANANNFGFEEPRQALWITHPTNGITFSMPVNVGEKRKRDIKSEWVSWSK